MIESKAAVAVALAAAVGLAVTGVVRGTWAAGGSDSSCYALMADALAQGMLQPSSDLASSAPWPRADFTFAPAGFIPSPVHQAAASPVCAPGYSLLMVPFVEAFGRDGVFLATPAAACFLVVCTFLFARNLAGAVAGGLSAVVVATSPIVLFQTVQPMNDIATAALWMGALAAAPSGRARAPLVAGGLAGLAVLVRPNLAPLAGVLAIWTIGPRQTEQRRVQRAVLFAIGSAPWLIALLVLNWSLYGDPLQSGYGSAADLFSTSYIVTNAANYGRAWIATQSPFPLLALAAPLLAPKDKRGPVVLGLVLAATTAGIYLVYRPFDEWWYLRFLLPAVVIVSALAAAALVWLCERSLTARRSQVATVATAALALALFGVSTARARQAFDLQRLESRFRHTGEFIRGRLAPNSVFITVWQSGTVRFHADRRALLWDSLDPAAFDGAVDWLQSRGLEPFILLERWEEPAFRARFAGTSRLGALDWPPRYEVDRLVRIYAPADREPYVRGNTVPTEYVFPR